jgi:hypothetical protein
VIDALEAHIALAEFVVGGARTSEASLLAASLGFILFSALFRAHLGTFEVSLNVHKFTYVGKFTCVSLHM